MEDKVMRVWSMCIRTKRFALADKIKFKYGRYFYKSDLVMSFGLALLATQNLPKKKT